MNEHAVGDLGGREDAFIRIAIKYSI